MCPWQSLNQPTRTTDEEEALVWVQVLVATNPVVEDPEVEVVVGVDMTKADMITVVDMTHMVEVMVMETIMIVIMMVEVVMVEVVMVVDMVATVDMAMMDMVEGEVIPVVVEEVVVEVVQEARTPVVVKVGQAGVDQVVVEVVADLVVELGAHVVVHQEEGVGKVEEGALVHKSVNMVVTAIKGVVAAATLNQRGSMLITISSTASRSHSSSGAKTMATVTRVINSGTRTAGLSSSGSDYADLQLFDLSNQICDELIQFFCLEPNHFFIFDWIGKLGQTLRKRT